MNLETSAQLAIAGLRSQMLERQLWVRSPNEHDIDFSSNDYLGLTRHAGLLWAGLEEAKIHGVGATGSRLLSGNLACHQHLEDELALFKRMPSALLFGSGYQANSTVLAALLDAELWAGHTPQVFCDRLNHASLHHAIRLQGQRQHRFAHNNLEHLELLLRKHARPGIPNIICTETVFGMEGSLLPITQLADLALQYEAVVYLDEAHATGVWGPDGRGLGATLHPSIEALKAMGHWVLMGTLGKALGVSGAYVACGPAVKAWLINRCSGFVYSTAPSPFVVGAVRHALQQVPHMHAERAKLFTNADLLRQRLQEAGFNTGQSSSHIVPIILGAAHDALNAKTAMAKLGIVVSAVRPPTVPPNSARLRMALCAFHSAEHIKTLSEGLIDTLQRKSNASTSPHKATSAGYTNTPSTENRNAENYNPAHLVCTLVLAHGWGYAPEFFDAFITWLHQNQSNQPLNMSNIRIVRLDSGYFASTIDPQENLPGFAPPQIVQGITALNALYKQEQTHPHNQWFGLGHSLGFAKLLQSQVAWNALCSVNGFCWFTKPDGLRPGASPKVLQRMIEKFKLAPMRVLTEFQSRCGHVPQHSASPILDFQILLSDLQLLMHLDYSAALQYQLNRHCTVMHLASTNDPIVSHQLLEDFPISAKLPEIINIDGPHAGFAFTSSGYTQILHALRKLYIHATTMNSTTPCT